MKQYILKPGFLDRQRKLILTEDYVEFENKDLTGHEFTRLLKTEISDIKYGVDWIVWYKFTVGRQFSITFKDGASKELKIVFRDYFKLNSHYTQIYSGIVNDLWTYYHQDIVNEYLAKFYKNEEFSIQGLTVNEKGVVLKEQGYFIPWDKLSLKEYYRYFALFDKDNPKTHSRVSYNDYGTEILWSSIKTILKEKEV